MPIEWNFSETPKPYGTFHIIWLCVAAIGVILALLISKKPNKKRDNIIVFTICLILFLTEIYKQLFQFKLYGKYNWGAFPFQLCSIPMYVGIIGPLVKNKNIKEAIFRYIAFTGLIGGIAILSFPSVSLSSSILLSNHSMFWHSILVFLGIYLIRSRGYGKNIIKETLSPSIILFIVLTIALILNLTLYPIAKENNCGFNMISLSYYQKNDPPLLDMIFQVVPYPVYVLIVYIGIYLSMPLITSTTYLIRLIVSKFKR